MGKSVATNAMTFEPAGCEVSGGGAVPKTVPIGMEAAGRSSKLVL
jgi:hypothetical protein